MLSVSARMSLGQGSAQRRILCYCDGTASSGYEDGGHAFREAFSGCSTCRERFVGVEINYLRAKAERARDFRMQQLVCKMG